MCTLAPSLAYLVFPFWRKIFSRWFNRILQQSISNISVITLQVFASYPGRLPMQTSRCNIVDKPLLSTLLLNRGKLRSCAFIQDSNPIKKYIFFNENSAHISYLNTAVLLNGILVVTSITPIAINLLMIKG